MTGALSRLTKDLIVTKNLHSNNVQGRTDRCPLPRLHYTEILRHGVLLVDIGKNSFHVVGLDARDAILLRQKWSRGQVEGRLANMPSCLIGMEACVGAHHLSRKLKAFGHDARLMPAKYVRPYSKGQKNDFRDAGGRSVNAATSSAGRGDGNGSSRAASHLSCFKQWLCGSSDIRAH